MSVTPSGSPAWQRTVSHEDYGGHVDKANYQSQGVVNPRTDVGAEAIARLASNMAAVTRTAPLAELTYLNNDTGTAAPTIEAVSLMTEVRVVSYEGDGAPSGFPSAARNGDGNVTFTFPSSMTDEYGQSADVNITHAGATAHGSTPLIVTVEILTANTVQVRVFDTAGSPSTDDRISLTVVTGIS